MPLQKFRWSKVYESQEEELLDFLAGHGLNGERHKIDEFELASGQVSNQDQTIWCAEGSFKLSHNGSLTSMQPGDALPIAASVSYEITAGMSGCAYYITSDKQPVV